jgi:hypothetical protein
MFGYLLESFIQLLYLHHVPNCEYVVNQQHDENYNHEISEITMESNEPIK